VTVTIGGRDAVEEYTTCKIFPLAASFGFESVPLGMTPISRVETPLPLFAVGTIAAEYADRFWQRWRQRLKRCWGASDLENMMPSDWQISQLAVA
jgi:hypothetical protein